MKNVKFINKKLKETATKNKTAAIAIMACCLFALAGCGSAGNTSQTAENENSAEIPEDTAETQENVAETQEDIAETQEEAVETQENTTDEEVELTILAAASLTDVCNEIKDKYEAIHDNVTLTFSYGGSGALQTQIEEGAPADIFISAAMTQMNALDEEGLMDTDTIVELLENKVVLIVPKDSELVITDFSEAADEKITMIGLGDPASVPVGQYAEEIFTSLGILDTVKEKANYGTDVRNVLSWVESGEVDCGVVYATDAGTTDNVIVVASAPEGSCKPVIYPAGVVKSSEHKEAANTFLEYLQSEEIMALFESYGFSAVQ